MKKDIKIYIDSIDENTIKGWFINTPAPENNKLLLYLDAQYKAVTLADIERQDVADAHGQLHSGFCFDMKKFPLYANLELRSESKEILLSLKTKQNKNSDIKKKLRELKSPYSQASQKLKQISIDLSRQINGTNWYDAEPGGRWGGPEIEGTLSLPALTTGKYLLELEIGNEFCDLETMEVMFNKKPVKFLNTEYHSPVILKAEVEAEKDYPFWQLIFNYSKTCPPEGNLGTDQRKLGVFLKAVTLIKT